MKKIKVKLWILLIGTIATATLFRLATYNNPQRNSKKTTDSTMIQDFISHGISNKHHLVRREAVLMGSQFTFVLDAQENVANKAVEKAVRNKIAGK